MSIEKRTARITERMPQLVAKANEPEILDKPGLQQRWPELGETNEEVANKIEAEMLKLGKVTLDDVRRRAAARTRQTP